MTRRQKILTAAENGRISFYTGRDHVEYEFNEQGEPEAVDFKNGVCAGCVSDVEMDAPRTDRCCIGDLDWRAATVDEVACYIGAIP